MLVLFFKMKRRSNQINIQQSQNINEKQATSKTAETEQLTIPANYSNKANTTSNSTSKSSDTNCGDLLSNSGFQKLVEKLIDETIKLSQYLEPIQAYRKVLDEELSKQAKNPKYGLNVQRIQEASNKLKVDAKDAQDFLYSEKNKMFEFRIQIELENRYPKELEEFTHIFQRLATAEKDDVFKALLKNLSYRLNIEYNKLELFFDLTNNMNKNTQSEKPKWDLEEKLEEIIKKLPEPNKSSYKINGQQESSELVLPKLVDQLLNEIEFDEPDRKEDNQHHQDQNLANLKANLQNEFNKVKESIKLLNIKLKNYSQKQIVSYVLKWSTSVKGKLSSNQIYEAIAIMSKANELATGGHVLRDIQILTVLIFHLKMPNKGRLCQVNTGEGNTTIISILAALKALQGSKVDVITSNAVLAADAINNKQLYYDLLCLNVAHNNFDDDYQGGKRACYNADIVYGNIGNFQFDHLRDRFLGYETRGSRIFDVVIVDEVDSMIIDNASHIAKLAEPYPGMESLRYIYIKIWQELINSEEKITSEFKKKIEEKLKNKSQDEANKEYAIMQEEFLDTINDKLRQSIKETKPTEINLIPKHLMNYAEEKLDKWIDNAIRAKYEFHLDQQYIIREQQKKNEKELNNNIKSKANNNVSDENEKELVIIPVDFQNTGITLKNTIWSNGLHQFLQLKHNLHLTSETLTSCFISNLGYIKQYATNNMFGITGTLGSKAEQSLLAEVYNLDFAIVPTYITKRFIENSGLVVKDEGFGLVVAAECLKRVQSGRAVLIICETIQGLKEIYSKLEEFKSKSNMKSENLNIKIYDNEDKSETVTHVPVKPGDIIIATNLAGRGTDLRTTDELEAKGGLHVCVSFLPCNKRVEDQAFGRTSRQGKRGTAQLIIKESEIQELGYRLDDLKSKDFSMSNIKQTRDVKETNRLKDIRENKVRGLEFQDELFNRFSQMYMQLKTKCKSKTEFGEIYYVLDDLKEYWTFRLESLLGKEEKFTKADAEVQFKMFIQKAAEKGIIKVSIANNDQQTTSLSSISVGTIQHNPYYSIQQAELLLTNRRPKEAKECIDHALDLAAETKDYFYSAYAMLFEVALEQGRSMMERFYQALGKLIFIDYEKDDEYKSKAIANLDKALKALDKELNYIKENLIGDEEKTGEVKLNENLTRIIVLTRQPDNNNEHKPSSSENLLVKHIISRRQTLILYVNHFKSLKEQMESSNDGFAINTRIPGYFKSVNEIKPTIMDVELNELGLVGLSTTFALRPVYDVPDQIIRSAQLQISMGLASLAAGFAIPPALPIMQQIAGTLIAEGICDFTLAILNGGAVGFDQHAYIKGKVISYAISAATLGLSALASSAKILDYAINAYGYVLHEVGAEHKPYDGTSTINLLYRSKMASNGSTGHFGDENSMSSPNNCLFDEMSRQMGVDSAALRFDAEQMRTVPYAMTEAMEILLQFGIHNREFTELIDRINDSMLVGGQHDQQDYSMFFQKFDEYMAEFGLNSNWEYYKIIIDKTKIFGAVDEVHVMKRNGVDLVTTVYGAIDKSTLRSGNRQDFQKNLKDFYKHLTNAGIMDDAGHLIASYNGGTGHAFNLAFQFRHLNQGWTIADSEGKYGPNLPNWRCLERIAHEFVDSGECTQVKIKVDVCYNADSNRPVNFIQTLECYRADGAAFNLPPVLYNNNPVELGLHTDSRDLIEHGVQGWYMFTTMAENSNQLPINNDSILLQNKILKNHRP
ncbi:unnamed protein product [Rotaria sp. Silwood2]|nr:unnamed protein product [Rotaria sp. Silwood2]CAF4383751.1 unnamed protein product [Rotaria sp. Silwood2]